eukprot:TRINITY_DN10560_c0_g1_i1.p1 TRINITY_DN10560_c0_g1~~TRINITY_DN10560_c0_g1_i1.p1  ORF type:complete len:730 (-),score=129.43 TRINITY_DN10560_c0_g1_i1:1-2190(-)
MSSNSRVQTLLRHIAPNLASATAGIFALAQHSVVASSQPVLGFAVFGVGRIGSIRASALLQQPGVRLLYAVDVDATRVKEFASRFGCEGRTDPGEVLSDSRVHAVLISTNTPSHADLVRAAVRAGKHVFCEKPLALSGAITEELLIEAEQRGTTIVCGFNRRFDEHLQRAHSKIRSLGTPELIRITSRDAATHNSFDYLRTSGGFFYDSLIHDFDVARWMAGGDPHSVFCAGHAFIDEIGKMDDVSQVQVVLVFDHCLVTIDNNRRATYGYDQRLEVHCPGGMIQVQNQPVTSTTTGNVSGFHESPLIGDGMQRYMGSYGSEVHSFIDVVRGTIRPAVSHHDIRMAARIADACRESLRTGGVVNLVRKQVVSPVHAQPLSPPAWTPAQHRPLAMQGDVLGVAVVGYGRMGHIHAANVANNPRSKLLYVVARNVQKAGELAKLHGAVATSDLQAVLRDGRVHAIVIASATDTHASMIQQCASARKAVFCEKPIALRRGDIEACFEACEHAQVPLLCAYNRRFDPSFAALRADVCANRIGAVEQLRVTSRDHPPPPAAYLANATASGGFFHDFSTHDIDTARWIMREEPCEVYAVARASLPQVAAAGDVDTAILLLKFPSGASCLIDNSRRTTYGYDQRVEAIGAEGMLQARNHHRSLVSVSTEQGVTADVLSHSFPERYVQAYAAEWNHFCDVCLTGVAPAVTRADCLANYDVSNAAARSLATGAAVLLK